MENSAIKAFRDLVENKWDEDDRAAFGMVAEILGGRTTNIELYCEGNFNVMITGIMEEISEIIVRSANNESEVQYVYDNLSNYLKSLCQKKWEAKNGNNAPFAELEGGVQ